MNFLDRVFFGLFLKFRNPYFDQELVGLHSILLFFICSLSNFLGLAIIMLISFFPEFLIPDFVKGKFFIVSVLLGWLCVLSIMFLRRGMAFYRTKFQSSSSEQLRKEEKLVNNYLIVSIVFFVSAILLVIVL